MEAKGVNIVTCEEMSAVLEAMEPKDAAAERTHTNESLEESSESVAL